MNHMPFHLSPTEFLGYAASIFIGVSLLMSDMTKLRWINLVGCILFVIYGLYIRAYPVAIMNLFGAMVNIWHLYKLFRQTTQHNRNNHKMS